MWPDSEQIHQPLLPEVVPATAADDVRAGSVRKIAANPGLT
jgi:hypothetical protein